MPTSADFGGVPRTSVPRSLTTNAAAAAPAMLHGLSALGPRPATTGMAAVGAAGAAPPTSRSNRGSSSGDGGLSADLPPLTSKSAVFKRSLQRTNSGNVLASNIFASSEF